jgi:hypothetical protein
MSSSAGTSPIRIGINGCGNVLVESSRTSRELLVSAPFTVLSPTFGMGTPPGRGKQAIANQGSTDPWLLAVRRVERLRQLLLATYRIR